jgi:hypothetical protein
MKEEKILTKHPLGKSGKNIDKQKYETLKKAIYLLCRTKNSLTPNYSTGSTRAYRASSPGISVGMRKPLNSIWKLEK